MGRVAVVAPPVLRRLGRKASCSGGEAVSSSENPPVHVVCERCGARLRASAQLVGQSLPCPRCHGPVEVVLASSTAPADDGRALEGMMYGVLPPGEHSGPVVPVTLPEDTGDARPQPPPDDRSPARQVHPLSERPKLPRWPMFTRVLAFYAQTTAIVLWVVLAVVGTFVLCVGSVGLGLLIVGGQGMGFGAAIPWIVGLVITMAAIVVGVGWFVASAAVSLSILQDSAAGNDKIESWPDVVWIDWMSDSLYVLFSLIVSGGVGYLAARLAAASPPAMAASILASLYLLFPLVMLSTLVMQSPLLPCSPVVLASLARSGAAWLVFYLQTAVLGGVVVGTFALFGFVLGMIRNGALLIYVLLLAAGVLGVLCVGAQFLYFRLLGRLAWICAEQSREALAEEEEIDVDEEAMPEGEPAHRPTPVDDF